MESTRTPPTGRLVADIKREAKSARRGGETHTEALERLSRERGYESWDALTRACAAASPPDSRTTPGGLPVDPVLRPLFDDTPNEQRSQAELDRWWNRPFVVSQQDGSFDVRCLDGGAWDRSTWYGSVQTLEAADEMASSKLAAWLRVMGRLVICWDESPLVVRMPLRPGGEMEVLYRASDSEDAARFIASVDMRQAKS